MIQELHLIQPHLTADFLEINEAPTKFVTRVRGGKVQRRVRVQSVRRKGYKLKGNRVVRENPVEARNRRRGAIKAARKRRSKKAQINRKRMRSILRRSRLHLKRGR